MSSFAAHEWFATPGPFTDASGYDIGLTDAAAGRPVVEQVVDVVQGLLIYDLVAQPFYGVDLAPDRAIDEINVRDVRAIMERALELSTQPLSAARAPDARVCVRCHNYTKLTVSLLRFLGLPARSRCGFGSYFVADMFEDHWIAEYWNGAEARWVMVDAQLDEVWRRMIGFGGDPFDLTGDEFVTAGRAWQQWRADELDPSRYGLSLINEHGAHWIAGNLRLDFAALNKIEMLPWDVWGVGWPPNQPVPQDLSVFDAMSSLAADPDSNLDAIRSMYANDERVRMPGTVFNVLRQAVETVQL